MLLRERDGDAIELTVSLRQLKKLYLALFRQLHAGLEDLDEIDDDDMLLTMQQYLQKRAAEAGVDGTDHSQWEAFLGVRGAPSCEQRFRHRRRDGDA